MAPIGAKEMS